MRFDMSLVLHQLKYLAVVNTIKIRKFGYPHKMKFQAFVDRYKYLLNGQLQRGSPYKELCRSIFDQVNSIELGKFFFLKFPENFKNMNYFLKSKMA